MTSDQPVVEKDTPSRRGRGRSFTSQNVRVEDGSPGTMGKLCTVLTSGVVPH